jgi:undecaprenyl-diphosphatase
MDTVIEWTAQYLLWVMVAGFACVWLFAEHGRARLVVGVQAVIGLVLALAFLYIAKSVHHDPRPFVENPHVKPLFPHGRDDGFPSDHSIAAGLIALLVLIRHRIIGLPFVAAAVAIAWARVAAHVHHLQDVVAGLLLGALAAALAVLVTRLLPARNVLSRRAPADRGRNGTHPARTPSEPAAHDAERYPSPQGPNPSGK